MADIDGTTGGIYLYPGRTRGKGKDITFHHKKFYILYICFYPLPFTLTLKWGTSALWRPDQMLLGVGGSNLGTGLARVGQWA